MSIELQETLPLQTESIIARYFETFNAGEFEATAALFAETGQLLAPFEEPIIGPDAIARYLLAEAEGMEATPKVMSVETDTPQHRRIIVKGQVTAMVFKVNAAWIFEQNAIGQLESVRVKLLASMQELLHLRG